MIRCHKDCFAFVFDFRSCRCVVIAASFDPILLTEMPARNTAVSNGEAGEQSVLPEAGLVLPPSLLPSSLPAFLSRSIRSRRRGAGGRWTDGRREGRGRRPLPSPPSSSVRLPEIDCVAGNGIERDRGEGIAAESKRSGSLVRLPFRQLFHPSCNFHQSSSVCLTDESSARSVGPSWL